MTLMVLDGDLEARLIEERSRSGADKYDEVWEGVYMMAPLPNDEHQEIVAGLVRVFVEILGDSGAARVRPGVNLAPLDIEDWKHDFRVPDVAVFLADSKAKCCDTHWRGPADFLVEVTSPGDHTHEKIPFYAALGVRELLVVEREGWALELFRNDGKSLAPAGVSRPGDVTILASEILPFTFQLLSAAPRPLIQLTHTETGRTWKV